jgi:ribonucleoside-diphosphate reductase alpha chain
LSFDKVLRRLTKLKNDKNLGHLRTIDVDSVAQRVVSGIYDGVSSSELDEEAARIAVSLIENVEYGKLASRIIISNLHKNTSESFSETMEFLYSLKDSNGIPCPLLADNFIEVVRLHGPVLDTWIQNIRDYKFDYFGYKTLEKGYLLRVNGKVVERPQYLYLRVAIQVHLLDAPEVFLENVKRTYELVSEHYFTFASPTMFNSGTRLNNLASCFLLGTHDSIAGIYKTISDTAMISKVGGGIGIHVSNVRSKGSLIRGTNGTTDGILPMMKVYNETAKYVNQGSRRKGSFAMYLSPEHPEIMEFLDLRKNQGNEDFRTRDLFLAVWVPDLFMRKVEENQDWYLMNPDTCRGLNDVFGEEYEKLYQEYVDKKMYHSVVKAQDIWTKILESQIETGTPYLLYKDQANLKSNQKNIGTIKSSNLCAEVLLYSDEKEYACCNLASVALPKFVKTTTDGKKKGELYFDHDQLFKVAKSIVLPMNNVIDSNHYPVPETKISNLKHRPIGVGVQGLCDVFVKMRLAFESEEARQLNREIFETLYFGVMTGSNELAKTRNTTYETFSGSPFSQGLFQFDLWYQTNGVDPKLSGRWDWDTLKENVKKYGVLNSTLTTCMPTASSSQIMGNTEAIEPFDSCIFKRRVLSGEYIVANKYLVEDLTRLGLWSREMKDLIIANSGSIQNLHQIPEEIRMLYKTVWEISMKTVIDQAADRGVFVDMTQSMNLFMRGPTIKKLTSMHFYGWKRHLKTGIYYLRSQNSSTSGKFGIDAEIEKRVRMTVLDPEAQLACSLQNPESCELCSS